VIPRSVFWVSLDRRSCSFELAHLLQCGHHLLAHPDSENENGLVDLDGPVAVGEFDLHAFLVEQGAELGMQIPHSELLLACLLVLPDEDLSVEAGDGGLLEDDSVADVAANGGTIFIIDHDVHFLLVSGFSQR
jgi:hypothetical protein